MILTFVWISTRGIMCAKYIPNDFALWPSPLWSAGFGHPIAAWTEAATGEPGEQPGVVVSPRAGAHRWCHIILMEYEPPSLTLQCLDFISVCREWKHTHVLYGLNENFSLNKLFRVSEWVNALRSPKSCNLCFSKHHRAHTRNLSFWGKRKVFLVRHSH